MIRLIKRYGSRKLYDTEESRYVLLDDIAAWIREGQEVRVIDNKTGEDVTSPTLTQVISEEGRRGTAFLPNDVLHELIRVGASAVNTGVARLQHGVDKLVQVSIDRLAPVRQAREEMGLLRQRLDELEALLLQAEVRRESTAGSGQATQTAKASKAPAPRSRRAKAARTTRARG